MTNIYVGDLHGNLYAFEKAIEEFESKDYNKIVFLGDYVDSYEYSDVEILHLLKSVIEYKKANPDKVILLLGNHDWQYYNLYEDWFRCSGFRMTYCHEVYDIFSKNKDLFQIGFKQGEYLATHAGISNKWYSRYADRLYYYAQKHLDIKGDFDTILNIVKDTHDNWILSTIGKVRGGYGVGGPLWADKTEMNRHDSDKRFKQIIGHTGVHDILTVDNVTFIDCLYKTTKFLTIDHE